MDEDCKRTQDDEKTVLLSMYEKEARFEINAWKVWNPISVIIHLKPLDSASRGGDAPISIDLNVVCSVRYPIESPNVSLHNPKGVSKEMVTVLLGKLYEKCKELKGNPVIMELCSEIQNFLYEHSGPVRGSFHDNMVKNLQDKQTEQRKKRLDSDNRDVEQVIEIVKEREQYNQEGKNEDKPKPMLTDSPTRVIAGKTIVVKSSTFTKRQRPHNFCNEWIGVYQNEEVLISEWNFKYTLGRQGKKKEPYFQEFLRKLNEVEEHIKRFPTLTGLDQTVVPYLICTVEKISVVPSSMNICIIIGQKIKESEQSLPSIINSIKHESNLCRHLAGHAVCALRWLHEEGLVHGAISANSFWFSDNTFRLSDAGTLAYLLTLTDVFKKCINGNQIQMAGDERHTRKKDLFALGTMIDGIRLDQENSTSNVGMNHDLTNFITACQGAKTVEELLNMPYLKVDLAAGGSGSSRFGTWHMDENCRLLNEFILMKALGSGGFGDVLLARNKVDDANYAIKRIPLYANSERLNRRITREAKLFAKLNHQNVVRYYSAWIENVGSKTKELDISKKPSPRGKVSVDDSLLPSRLRNLEKKQPIGGEMSEWSSYVEQTKDSMTSSSEEESNQIQTLFDRGTEDDFEIYFEGSGQGFSRDTEVTDDSELESATPTKEQSAAATPLTVATSSELDNPGRLLYIQMEFCGHGTLRSFIDNNSLNRDTKKIWRMFREILSGLSYIHKQGMIHRDIKPMNILLDEENHIKIGDFGLATRDFFRRMDSKNMSLERNSEQTKDIGTELYMAPELTDLNENTPYSSKIDVYSLGVVLFELFYKPLPFGRERIDVLKTLRQNIKFPTDFEQGYTSAKVNLAKKIITMMLQHKAENRPSVETLLEDERITVDVDEQILHQIIQKSIKRGTQAHRNLLTSLFKEDISGSQNYCYDINFCQEKIPNKNLHLQKVKTQLEEVLAKHCFEPLYTHQLLSSTSVHAIVEPRQNPAYLLDQQGFPVALPLDLRQNFIRYCCRNEVYRKKRYCADRVFRNTEGIGFEHPTERWECSVDYIGPITASATSTAEMLIVAVEICTTALPQVNFTLKVGHIGFVLAACRHLSITEDQTNLLLQKFHEISTSNKIMSSFEKINVLTTIIGQKQASSLLNILPSADNLGQFKEACKALLRSNIQIVKEMAKKAMAESEVIYSIFDELNIPSNNLAINFDASLVYRPATFHDGLMFMIVTENSTKKGSNRAIVLGGGRYDSSLARERHPKDSQPKEPLCLIGCSIALDVIVLLRKYHKERCSPICSALICSYKEEFTIEKFSLAKKLWDKNISADIIHEPIKQISDFLAQADSLGIAHTLIVFGKNEVLVHSDGIDYGKQEFDVAIAQCSPESDDEHEVGSLIATPLSTSKSMTMIQTVNSAASYSNCDIKMAIPERVPLKDRKRIINAVRTAPPEAVSLFAQKSKIEILVTELPSDLVKNIAGSVSRSTSITELSSIFDALARQFGKSKEDLECLFDFLRPLLTPRGQPVPIIILFRHVDGFHKVII